MLLKHVHYKKEHYLITPEQYQPYKVQSSVYPSLLPISMT